MKTKLLKLSSVLFLFVISILVWKLNTNENITNKTLKSKTIIKKTIENSIVELEKDSDSLVSENNEENIQIDNHVSSKLTTDISQYVEMKSNSSSREMDSIERLRIKYHDLVNNHPFRKRMHLPKKERKAMGLPPNAYNEQEWLYTADPNLGRPTPEVVLDLQKSLDKQLEEGRVPGDGLDNQWVERGSNNVGGRTRVLRFANGSTTKVFATMFLFCL